MKEILLQTYTIALPILLGYIVWLLQEQKKKQKEDAKARDKRIAAENMKRDANSKGTMLLLRSQLIEYHEKWTKRGYTTKHGIEQFTEMYDSYHKLGGNGMATQLLAEIKELPIKG